MNLIVCELGRMGDIVASEPLFRYLKEKYPADRLIWYTTEPFAELLQYAPFIDETRIVRNADEYWEAKKNFAPEDVAFELNLRAPNAKKTVKNAQQAADLDSLLCQFARGAGIGDIPDETPVFHFSPQSGEEFSKLNLPEKYAVFHCVSQGKSRQYPAAKFRKLAQVVMAEKLPVVEIGFKTILDFKGNEFFTDFTGARSLQLLAQVISHAAFFVGVESGFGHIANAVNIPMVILSGKLRKYKEYMHYSGRARAGVACNIVRWYDEETDILPCQVAEHVLRRILDGRMMSGRECDDYCLKSQIEYLKSIPLLRLSRMISEPFHQAARAIRHHYLRQ